MGKPLLVALGVGALLLVGTGPLQASPTWMAPMGGHMGPGHMMRVYPPGLSSVPPSLAKSRLNAYAQALFPGGRLKDFMAFSENYYAQVVDEKGQGLAELILDRYTGVVAPEPGPNMIWSAPRGTSPRYTLEMARGLASGFIKDYLPGAKVHEEQAFSGYYTFDFGRNGVEGMLSVNAYTGEVWVHTWHGFFLGEE